MGRWTMRLGTVSIALFAVACAAKATSNVDDSGTGGGGTSGAATSSGAGGAPTTSGASTSAGVGGDTNLDAGSMGSGCADSTKKVYVLAKTQELYGFEPASLALTKVGVVNCPQNGGSATPFSMAVDRSGKAWVLYNDGALYNVDTTTAACSATSYVPNQQGYKKFGMGFVSNSVGSMDETLFIANEVGIAKLDTDSLSVSPVGSFGFSAAAELTGTGDARLFGFFYGFPPYIAEIDKTSSQTLAEHSQDNVDIGTGWAFAFWGGDFWIFTAPDGVSSQIDRYQPSNGTTTTVKTNLGFKVIGAGVSTCAPIEPPK